MSTNRALRLATMSFTHFGGRDYNEDSIGEFEASGSVRFFTLADGAGGHGGGDVASRTAVEAARAAFLGHPVFSPSTLQLCMDKADQAIQVKQKDESRLAQMASTFVALMVDCELHQALLGNLGDSRCYIFRGNQVLAQSHDHSLVQRFIDAGLYPAEKLRQHPRRNVLFASLGANSENIAPYITPTPIDLKPGDGALLCSDGVWELLDEATLCDLHFTSETVEIWRDRLQALIQKSMPVGHDNFSAALLRVLIPAGNF